MWTLFRFEIRHILRDFQALVVVAVIIPVLLAPFVQHAFQRVARQAQEAQKSTFFVSIYGPRAAQFREILPSLGRFRELHLQTTPEMALQEGLIDCYITVEPAPRSARGEGESESISLTPQVLRGKLPDTPLVTIHYSSARDRSWRARNVMQEGWLNHLKRVRNSYLLKMGQNPAQLYRIEDKNLATTEQERLQTMAVVLPVVLIFVLFGTGSVTALDAIAGERERGSLATVLVSSLTRYDIALAKWLTVVAVSLGFGVLQLGGLYFRTKGFAGAGLAMLGWGSWVAVFALALLLCGQVSALLLWISVRSSTFKQAQLLYMPALLVAGALAALAWLQELPLRSILLIVPISGLSLAVRDTLLLNGSPLWIGLASLASLLTTAFTLHSVAGSLQLDLSDGPPADRPEEQMRQQLGQDIGWFYATMGALMVVIPGNLPVFANLRGQVALNQGLMLLVPLLLLRLYRQPFGRALRWQPTSAWNWILVVLAAPLIHLCANSAAIISSWLVPMSEDMVRQMTELLLPAGASTAELLLLIAVSPAICEELAFRGVLLHAVHSPVDRVRPRLRTCFLVGLAFGAFHFSLQRMLPTSVIGVLLTWVALRTGSIWPCMLLHLCNNAMALLLEPYHLDYTAFPAWTWLVCWTILVYLLAKLENPASKGVRPADAEPPRQNL